MSDEKPLAERVADAETRASKLVHDLNNLVSVILGYAALLVELAPADSPGRRMAEEVQNAAERAAEMSRELLEARREQRALEAELRAGAAAPKSEKPERKKKNNARTVLVVEDDTSVRRLAESILKRGGYNVLMAAESGAAIRLCESHDGTIDLMLTDVVLPGESGTDVVAKALKLRPKMRVLYMSGYSPEGLPGAGTFLPKPFSADILLSKVESLLAENAR